MACSVDISWLMTILVGLLTLFLARQYLKRRSFPPGPFPWPVVGNLLSFRYRPVLQVMQEFRNNFGDVFTLWLGSKPFVIVSGLPEIKEALLERRNDFAGRADLHTLQIHLDGNCSIGDTDYGKAWETLRKMGHAAVRKYTVSEELPPLVDENTNEIVGKMLKAKDPFDCKNYIYLLISKIIASSIFGKSFQKDDDPEFLAFQEIAETFQTTLGNGSAVDFIPILRPFYRDVQKKFKKASRDAIDLCEAKLNEHIASYEPGLIRDIIDSLLSAREEVIAEGKESAVYMNNKNLAYAIFDLYFASIETTQITVRWVLLYLATHPDIQNRVIEELRNNLGDRLPVQDDRKLCPFTTAVIEEVLRIRTAAPFAVPHKAICDSQIGGHRIRKGTTIVLSLEIMHNDPLHWENPEKFYPERFLANDGSHSEARMSQFMPFSQGRRSCIGEKLAMVEMFMVVAGIFRRCRIELKEPPEDMQPVDVAIFHMPKPHKIIVKPLVE